jgi:hypothetical protein
MPQRSLPSEHSTSSNCVSHKPPEPLQLPSGHTNAMAKSFNATIKKLIHLHTWPTLSKAKKETFHYIEVYYNRKRPHSRIGNLTPCEVERNWCQESDKESLYAG